MAEDIQPTIPTGLRGQLQAMERLNTARQSGNKREELAAMIELSGLLNATESPDDPLAPQRVDKETGAPSGVRSATSIKMTPAGKIGYLESVYGKDNVAQRQDGELFFRSGPQAQWTQVDEEGWSLRDVADLTGGAIEAGPPVAAGFATLNPAAVGLAAAGGNAARQAASAALPGNDQMTMTDRAGSLALSALLAGAGQAGVNAIARGFDKVRPHNVVASNVRNSLNTKYGKQGLRLQRETGIEYSPGQLSGSKGQLTVEGLARRHPASADLVQNFDEAGVNQANRFIRSLQDRVNPSGAGPITAGTEVQNTFKGSVKAAVDARRAQWNKDFAPVMSQAGDSQIFPLNSTKAEIQSLIDDFDVPGGGDATATLISRLKGVKSELDKPLSAKQTQRLMQLYGKVARGEGQLFKDIDKGQQRAIASRVMSAIQRDLDDFAEGGGQSGPIVQALRQARTNWRQNSQAIDDLENSVLGRMFGGKTEPAPENVAEKFLKMRGSEVKAAAEILDAKNPQAMEMVRGNMIEAALRKALPASSSADQFALSPAKFNSFLRSHAEQFQAAFLGSGKNRQLGELKHAYEALGRLANRGGTDGSPTAPLMLAWDMAQSAFTMNPVGLARNTITVLAPRKIARIMSTREGRQALITLSRVSPRTKAYANAAAVITGVLAKDEKETKSAATDYFNQSGDKTKGQAPKDGG